MKFKKKIALFLSVLTVCSALAATVGCVERDSGKQTVVVSILNQTSEKDMYNAVKEAFEEKYPDVNIEFLPLSNYETDVRNKLKSNETIDVLHVPDSHVTLFASDNVLENLEPFIEESGFDRSLYFESMMNMGRLNFNPENDQYMIPRDYSKFVVYYNKTMFDQYGVDYPESGWTWDDFKETCRQLKSQMPSGYYCVDASMSYDILNYGVLASCGADLFLDEEYNLIADTSAIETGLEMLKSDMIDPGYACKPEIYSSINGDFVRQRAPMRIDVRPALATFKNARMDFDVVEFPAIGEDPKVGTGSSGFGICTTSQVKDLAFKWISFVVSEEGQRIMSQSGSVVPVLKSLAESADAEWKKTTNGQNKEINQEPFFSLNERDVVGAKWGDLPIKAVGLYGGYWSKCMNDYLNGKETSLTSAIATMRKSIVSCKRTYPEYFE